MSKKYIYLRNAMYILGGTNIIFGLVLLLCYFDPLQKFLFSLDWWVGALIVVSVVSVWSTINAVLFSLAEFIEDYGKEHPYTNKKNRRIIDFK